MDTHTVNTIAPHQHHGAGVEAVWVAGLLTLGELTLLVSDALRFLHATIGLSLIP